MDPNQQPAAQSADTIAAGAHIFNSGGPNVIANVEDLPNMQFGAAEETPVLGGADLTMEPQYDEEGSKFHDITGALKRGRKTRGKSPI